MNQDNRKGLRIDVRIPVQVWLESRHLQGEILNLSEGGAYLSCGATWKVGQKVRVHLEFSGTVVLNGKATSWEDLLGKAVHANSPLKKSATQSPIPDLPTGMDTQTVVRWAAASNKETANGFGVEFEGMDVKNREILRKIILYYENLRKAGVHFG